MSDFLIFGEWVFISSEEFRQNYALLIQDGRIAASGPAEHMRSLYPHLPEEGGKGTAILPGLINAHHHCYGIELINQGVEDDFLEPWMFNGPGLVQLPIAASTAYAALRLVKGGVTSVVDMCSAGSSSHHAEQSLISKAEAYRDIGIRAAIAPGERWQNRIVHGSGEESVFLQTLPTNLKEGLLKLEKSRTRLSPDAYLDLVQGLAKSNNNGTQFWFGPPGIQWTPESLISSIAKIVNRLDIHLQTHAVESYYEGLESPHIRGKSAIEYLDQLGLLSEKVSLAHAVWVSEKDLDLIRRKKVHISHNPSSNLRLRSGIAPAAQMVKSGITTALGMDGTSLAGDEDLFTEMRLARNLNRAPHPDGLSLSAREVFKMATESGARLMGLEKSIGKLENGFLADLVSIDLNTLRFPWVSPVTDPYELLVGRAKASDVVRVFVDGKIIVEEGKHVKLDEETLMSEISEALSQNEIPIELKTFQRALRPHLLQWYQRWNAPPQSEHQPVSQCSRRIIS